MKKFISFAVASAMVMSLVPATAFAASDDKVTFTATEKDGTILGAADEADAPKLILTVDGAFTKTKQGFYVNLDGAEFQYGDGDSGVGTPKDAKLDANEIIVSEATTSVKYSQVSDSRMYVEIESLAGLVNDTTVTIPLVTELTGDKIATVTVDGDNSEFNTTSARTFAKIASGDTVFTVEKTTDFYDGDEIKPLFIEEVTEGSIGLKANDYIRVKANSGFQFTDLEDIKVEDIKGGMTALCYSDSDLTDEIKVGSKTGTVDEFYIKVTAGTSAALLKITGINLTEDGADNGDVAKITVDGDGITRETIEVGKMVDFGINLTAEKKDLPVIFAGTTVDKVSQTENTTLKVTLKEAVVGSWIEGRKMTMTLPEGVEFVGLDDFDCDGFEADDSVVEDAITITKGDDNEITLMNSTAFEEHQTAGKGDEKRELELTFTVAAKADFTGDVELKVTGPAIANEELKAVIATVKAPIEVKTGVNEVNIDYKNTKINDIVIVEPTAGLWEKGDVVRLAIKDDNMSFEDTVVGKVTKGDMKIKDVKATKGILEFTIDSRSGKEAAEITLSDVELYLNRSLPAGDYELVVAANVKSDKSDNKVLLANYDESVADAEDVQGIFDTDEISVMKNFVKVVTAGRDDAGFTTQIVVPIGAATIKAGTKEIAVDAPAYINKDGYTMLPVRAVVEALNGMAAIRWDDATKTVTITFGQRVISMSVGSKTMNINGVATQLLAAPEIKNSRTFLPLRDLGYALGLKDDKIAWDSATSTATLN